MGTVDALKNYKSMVVYMFLRVFYINQTILKGHYSENHFYIFTQGFIRTVLKLILKYRIYAKNILLLMV